MRCHSVIHWIALAAPAICASTIPRANPPPPRAITAADTSHPPPPPYAPRPLQPRQCATVAVTFDELVTTKYGESVLLVGSIAALGNWNTASGVSLNASSYTSANPLWTATVSLAPGTSFQYKYVRVGTDGTVYWEADPNHSYTVPSGCSTPPTASNTFQQTSTSASTSTTASASTSTSRTSTSTSTRSTSSTSTSSTSTSTTSSASTCTNGPTSRSCWSNGFDINTDFDEDWPSTGKTVSYSMTVTNTTLAPDGYSRQGFAINGQFPGPTIYANWGDTIQVTVNNKLQNNGTAIHWHGMRLYHDNAQDGVPGVTECPIAPGQSKTYTFQATQYGTSWYHSHFSSQYGDGVWGAIVIYGPSTANYDLDLGPLPIQDWYYPGVFVVSARAQHQNALAPTADNGLINGTMVSSSGGAYAQTILQAGKKHRLRLVNTGIDNHFMFSLDNHILTVIAADFVPIVPYNTSWIFLGIGERYDVIITANQSPGSYWFRAEVQDTAGCGSNYQNGNILSIFSYQGHQSEEPISTGTSYTQRCTDETNIVPYWNSYVPQGEIPTDIDHLDTAINQSSTSSGGINLFWQVNGVHMLVDWATPTLGSIRDASSPDSISWGKSTGMIELDEDVWTYWVITEGAGSPFSVNIPHPIHLHGHDFYVLGSGSSAWTAGEANNLNYGNPPRRDVAMLPTNGWLALAFKTNNPGAWLMHCHIAWHADEGFAVQFLESASTILSVAPLPSDYDSQCNAWESYYPSSAAYLQSDSGI